MASIGSARAYRPWSHLRWLPFGLAAGWWLWLVLGPPPVLSTAWVLASMAVGGGWLLGRRLWVSALLLAVLALPGAWGQLVELPRLAEGVRAGGPELPVRLTGIVRGQARADAGAGAANTVLLGDVLLEQGPRRWRVPELEAEFSARWQPWQSYRRTLRVVGRAEAVRWRGGRLRLRLRAAEVHLLSDPLPARGREWLRQALADRAGYYLGNRSHAIYEPVLLGIRERDSPEGRAVAATFRRVGVAHLFAISGLHVGLLFLLFMGLAHWLGAPLRWRQGSLWGRHGLRAIVTVLVWAYVALIGFPLPAVRAALMGTLLVWSGWFGTRTPQLFVLGMAAVLLLALDPSQVHDLSFQLSFLAYLFVVAALLIWERRPPREGPPRLLRLLGAGAALNLLLTVCIVIGLWPVLAATFGRVSLLVFVGNLLMVPLLSAVVLPAGLLALGVSWLHLGAPPGGWLERSVFAILEWSLTAWAEIAAAIDRLGAGLVLRVELAWPPLAFVLYYGTVALIFWLARRALARPAPAQDRSGP